MPLETCMLYDCALELTANLQGGCSAQYFTFLRITPPLYGMSPGCYNLLYGHQNNASVFISSKLQEKKKKKKSDTHLLKTAEAQPQSTTRKSSQVVKTL